MKHVLIPTDFSINSLNAVHAALSKYSEEQLNITLFHLLSMPTNISDLLYRSRRNMHLEMITDDFNEALQVLQNRHGSRIRNIRVTFGFGDTVAYFNNFLEGEKADVVLVCPDIDMSAPSPRSVEMTYLIDKAAVSVDRVPAASVRKSVDIGAINMFIGTELKVPQKEKKYATEK